MACASKSYINGRIVAVACVVIASIVTVDDKHLALHIDRKEKSHFSVERQIWFMTKGSTQMRRELYQSSHLTSSKEEN